MKVAGYSFCKSDISPEKSSLEPPTFLEAPPFIHAPYYLTYDSRKYILVEKQISNFNIQVPIS